MDPRRAKINAKCGAGGRGASCAFFYLERFVQPRIPVETACGRRQNPIANPVGFVPRSRTLRTGRNPRPVSHQTLPAATLRSQAAAAPAPSVQFVFGLHNHQPVGNFDHVFAEAYDRAYHPFLELLEFYPAFRVCLHHTGPLLLWLADNRPQYLERLGALVDRGQVELLGGAFYEPILPIIPEADRIGQIEAMSRWLELVFGTRPRGIWLAERVWEPTLPRSMRAAGIEYTVLDDSHFRSVGIADEGNLGYWITEDQGDAVAVFPINGQLRYKIPYAEPNDTVQYLRSLASASLARTAVMADDGEKFGVWPDSHWHCYEQGWMYRFVEQISNNREWIDMKTFADVLDTTEPMGRVYLPAASYVEMMEWALPATAQREYRNLSARLKKDVANFETDRTYVRGGFWRSFLSKYDESNHIHKKMLRTSAKLDRAPEKFRRTEAFAQALDHLWRGQCNCAYWHGVFGGLYLTNLRTALYENLIAAESIADAAVHGESGWIEAMATDFDVDGQPEVIVESAAQALVVQPHKGGMLVEHDVRAARTNLLDTLMRRREAYHSQLDGDGDSGHQFRVKDRSASHHLAVDWHRRGSFVDHFLGRNATPENFRDASYPEIGDFANSPYACEWRKGAGEAAIVLRRHGFVRTESAELPVEVEKTLIAKADAAECSAHYRVTNHGRETLHARFGVEFNVNLLAADAPDRFHEIDGFRLGVLNRMNSVGEVPDVSSFRVRDGWKRLAVEWRLSTPATHWRLPIETVSNSEGGIERICQSTVVMPVWELVLGAGETWEARIEYGARVEG